MAELLTDYHVGLMRGFIKGSKADKDVMHAFEVLMNSYRLHGNQVIGQTNVPDSRIESEIRSIRKTAEEAEDHSAGLTEQKKAEARDFARAASVFWTEEDDNTIIEMRGGAKPAKPKAIGIVLNRPPSSVSNRIQILKSKGKL